MSGWAAPWFFFGSATAPPLVDVLMSAVAAAMLDGGEERTRSGPGLKLLSPARRCPCPCCPLRCVTSLGGAKAGAHGEEAQLFIREKQLDPSCGHHTVQSQKNSDANAPLSAEVAACPVQVQTRQQTTVRGEPSDALLYTLQYGKASRES